MGKTTTWLGTFGIAVLVSAAMATCRADPPRELTEQAAQEAKVPKPFDDKKPNDLWTLCPNIARPKANGNDVNIEITQIEDPCTCAYTQPDGQGGVVIRIDPRNCGDKDLCAFLAHEALHVPQQDDFLKECKAKFPADGASQTKCFNCMRDSYIIRMEAEGHCKQIQYEKDNPPANDSVVFPRGTQKECKTTLTTKNTCALLCEAWEVFKDNDGVKDIKACKDFVVKPKHPYPTRDDLCKCDSLAPWQGDKPQEKISCGGGTCKDGKKCESNQAKTACECKGGGTTSASSSTGGGCGGEGSGASAPDVAASSSGVGGTGGTGFGGAGAGMTGMGGFGMGGFGMGGLGIGGVSTNTDELYAQLIDSVSCDPVEACFPDEPAGGGGAGGEGGQGGGTTTSTSNAAGGPAAPPGVEPPTP